MAAPWIERVRYLFPRGAAWLKLAPPPERPVEAGRAIERFPPKELFIAAGRVEGRFPPIEPAGEKEWPMAGPVPKECPEAEEPTIWRPLLKGRPWLGVRFSDVDLGAAVRVMLRFPSEAWPLATGLRPRPEPAP
jgi:hypothetical protein